MALYYYLCSLDRVFSAQNLDGYELDLAFKPEWVNIDLAIETNKSVLASEEEKPLWTKREAFVLELLKAQLLKPEGV